MFGACRKTPGRLRRLFHFRDYARNYDLLGVGHCVTRRRPAGRISATDYALGWYGSALLHAPGIKPAWTSFPGHEHRRDPTSGPLVDSATDTRPSGTTFILNRLEQRCDSRRRGQVLPPVLG